MHTLGDSRASTCKLELFRRYVASSIRYLLICHHSLTDAWLQLGHDEAFHELQIFDISQNWK
jgi:hypothetical protein